MKTTFLLNVFSALLYLFCFSLSDCNYIKRENNLIASKIIYRDSLYVIYTAKEWHNCSCLAGYENYPEMYRTSNEQIWYFFAGTFYSPDKKRILIWLGEKMPNAKTNKIYNAKDSNVNKLCGDCDSAMVYSIKSIVGLRNDTNAPWSLYPLDIYSVDCCNTKAKAISYTEQFYFNAMKNSANYVVNINYVDTLKYGGKLRWDLEQQRAKYGLNKGEPGSLKSYILEDFGYNLQDKDFWNKSLIWEKGIMIKGYYLFQQSGNGVVSDTLKLPKINYPENILALYKR